jgi:hypothetical protein
MRNPTPSGGQNSQLVCWWLLVHAGREKQLTSCCVVPNQSLFSSFCWKTQKGNTVLRKRNILLQIPFSWKNIHLKSAENCFLGEGVTTLMLTLLQETLKTVATFSVESSLKWCQNLAGMLTSLAQPVNWKKRKYLISILKLVNCKSKR